MGGWGKKREGREREKRERGVSRNRRFRFCSGSGCWSISEGCIMFHSLGFICFWVGFEGWFCCLLMDLFIESVDLQRYSPLSF